MPVLTRRDPGRSLPQSSPHKSYSIIQPISAVLFSILLQATALLNYITGTRTPFIWKGLDRASLLGTPCAAVGLHRLGLQSRLEVWLGQQDPFQGGSITSWQGGALGHRTQHLSKWPLHGLSVPVMTDILQRERPRNQDKAAAPSVSQSQKSTPPALPNSMGHLNWT